MTLASDHKPRYSADDYWDLQGEWELWHGIPVATSPTRIGTHQLICANLVGKFRYQLEIQKSCCRVLHAVDWQVSQETVVRPDVLILGDEVPDGPLRNAPVLIVEVTSPASESKDRETKFGLYEQSGVKYYVIADPKQESIDAFQLVDGEYQAMQSEKYCLSLPDGALVLLNKNIFQ